MPHAVRPPTARPVAADGPVAGDILIAGNKGEDAILFSGNARTLHVAETGRNVAETGRNPAVDMESGEVIRRCDAGEDGERAGRLGLRLIHSQAATSVARATPDRKLAASLS